MEQVGMVPSQIKECWLQPEAAEVVMPCWHTYFFWPNDTDINTLASRMTTVRSLLSINYQVCGNLLWKSLETYINRTLMDSFRMPWCMLVHDSLNPYKFLHCLHSSCCFTQTFVFVYPHHNKLSRIDLHSEQRSQSLVKDRSGIQGLAV